MIAPLSPRINLHHPSVDPADSYRQRVTAEAILERLSSGPGVILADEVGMGKTYVALAVAASVIDASPDTAAVVVMVPPSVAGKWPREWRKFSVMMRDKGLPEIRATEETIRRPSDFLRLLDDPPGRQQQLIFVTHSALTSPMRDPLVQLAFVRRAFLRAPRRLKAQRAVFPRWANDVIHTLRQARIPGDDDVAALLRADPTTWRTVITKRTGVDPGDDPVPAAISEALEELDLEPLIDRLSTLPLRSSPLIQERLKAAHKEVQAELSAAWSDALRKMSLSLPLLILDEAHHAKNPWTNLARLFVNEDPGERGDRQSGALASTFDRMLFLTATPFQLGHNELIEVLRRFDGIRWDDLARDGFGDQLARLASALDEAQAAALRLDSSWGRLKPEQVAEVESWWERPDDPVLNERMRAVALHWQETRAKAAHAEELLRPLVIRHVRENAEARRSVLCGAGLLSDDERTIQGLDVEGDAVLPFLLVARAQGAAAHAAERDRVRARALFAEGLSSSFEAYRQTRQAVNVADIADDQRDEQTRIAGEVGDLGWYLDHIERALPTDDLGALGSHPKIAATTARSLDLWREREKVLVFCFYRATGAALQLHIARAVDAEVDRLAAAQLGLPPIEARAKMERLNDQLDKRASPAYRTADDALRTLLAKHLDGEELDRSVRAALRFLRTHTFLARYVDLRKAPADAIRSAFGLNDASGRTLSDLVYAFGEFLGERDPAERREYLEAVTELQTGDRRGSNETGERTSLVANVRLANGGVPDETRRRLLLGFNTPFFPEVLVASSVLAEGVDLHLACRHVIHHDLDWNPSVIEQRTGRLDRIGSKSEVTGHPIRVYEPFIQGAQDEKQFRVMKDRERWFNVVMGEKLELDEWSTDKLAERVPLPEAAARGVTMDLSVARRADARCSGDRG